MAVAGIGIYLAVKVSRVNVAVARVQPNIPFGAFQRDAAVAGVDIHAARDRLYSHRTVSGVNFYAAVDRLSFHRAVAGIHLQVRIFGHAHFNAHVAVAAAEGKAPMAGDAGIDLHIVAILASIDVQVLVKLVALVDDAELDLFAVAGDDAHAAIIGVHADLCAAGDGVHLGKLLGRGTRG